MRKVKYIELILQTHREDDIFGPVDLQTLYTVDFIPAVQLVQRSLDLLLVGDGDTTAPQLFLVLCTCIFQPFHTSVNSFHFLTLGVRKNLPTINLILTVTHLLTSSVSVSVKGHSLSPI
jgi:hypothetical protein